ncbi:hypothetical protein HC864_01215 [Candidatus Gracilibacteria bacterium]|nr:hypothetical protein [Candidatus Gracilibacteria bacterium]
MRPNITNQSKENNNQVNSLPGFKYIYLQSGTKLPQEIDGIICSDFFEDGSSSVLCFSVKHSDEQILDILSIKPFPNKH